MSTYEPTGEEIITHDGPDRGYRMCLCAECGEVQRCTPENDFWTAKGIDGLLCEGCFDRLIVHRGHKIIDARPEPLPAKEVD